MTQNKSLQRQPSKITEAEGDSMMRELSIQKKFFENPRDLSKILAIGENMIVCPRPPVEYVVKFAGSGFIWKTPEQIQREQADIIGQPVPVCAKGKGTLVDHIEVMNFVMLAASAQPARTFYIKNVKFDVYHSTDIVAVVPEEHKNKIRQTYKDNPPQATENKEGSKKEQPAVPQAAESKIITDLTK